MAVTPEQAHRDGAAKLAERGFVRGEIDVATWSNSETGEVGRLAYIPDFKGGREDLVAAIWFQGPAVNGVLPSKQVLVTY